MKFKQLKKEQQEAVELIGSPILIFGKISPPWVGKFRWKKIKTDLGST